MVVYSEISNKGLVKTYNNKKFTILLLDKNPIFILKNLCFVTLVIRIRKIALFTISKSSIVKS